MTIELEDIEVWLTIVCLRMARNRQDCPPSIKTVLDSIIERLTEAISD